MDSLTIATLLIHDDDDDISVESKISGMKVSHKDRVWMSICLSINKVLYKY